VETAQTRSRTTRFTTLQRVLLAAAIVGFLWVAKDLLLLLFTGVLLAVFLRTLAVWVAEHSGLRLGWSLALVSLVLFGGMIVAGVLFAPRLAQEVRQLSQTLPEAVASLRDQVRQTTFGGWILEQIGSGGGPQQQQQTQERAQIAVRRIMDGVVAVAIILFAGLYFATQPQPYQRGLVRMLPQARRQRTAEVLFAGGYTLRWWILGQLLSMTIVGLLMGIGLTIIGVPMAFALGVLAGLFEFIPTIGPIFGLLPALLLSLAEGPQSALYVVALYIVVQTIESYLLTPLVQERVLELPPMVTIATQVLFAWTLGPVGLLIAVPFVALAMVAVQMLYVKDVLGDRIEIHAEDAGRRELQASDVLSGVPGV
jgi:predicted PurR-regulated permease PerM